MITKDQLLNFGMTETTGNDRFITPLRKVISIPDPEADEDDEIGELAICVSNLNNSAQLALELPEGMLYINCQAIEELEAFEKMIASYEPQLTLWKRKEVNQHSQEFIKIMMDRWCQNGLCCLCCDAGNIGK